MADQFSDFANRRAMVQALLERLGLAGAPPPPPDMRSYIPREPVPEPRPAGGLRPTAPSPWSGVPPIPLPLVERIRQALASQERMGPAPQAPPHTLAPPIPLSGIIETVANIFGSKGVEGPGPAPIPPQDPAPVTNPTRGDIRLNPPPVTPRGLSPLIPSQVRSGMSGLPGQVEQTPPFLESRPMSDALTMAPNLATPSPVSTDMAPTQPAQPSAWKEFGVDVLKGLLSSITPNVVALAGRIANDPEIVTAWAANEANRVREADQAMQMEVAKAKLFGDLIAEQRAQEQLDLNRLNARLSVANDITKLQGDLAAKDPLTYMKSMQGYLPLWMAAGGDEDDFANISRMPNAALVKKLQDNYDDAYRRFAGQEGANIARIVTNPWMPEDPEANLTLQEAATFLGHVNPDGSFIAPLGALRASDVVERTTRDQAGVTSTTRDLLGTSLGETDKQYPQPDIDTLTVPDPTRGRTLVIRIDRKSGRMLGSAEIPGEVKGFAAIPSIGQELTEGTRRSKAIDILTQELGRYPSTREVNAYLDALAKTQTK